MKPFTLKVEAHRETWKRDFELEAAKVRSAFGPALIKLHHIGSTAIPQICAKPIIDMLAEVTRIEAADERAPHLQGLGYEPLGEFGIPGRRYFRKDDRTGTRTHQIHTFAQGSVHIQRHLAFRDYLIAHPETAQEYSRLKLELAQKCNNDIEAYMDGKDAFIKDIERKALEWASTVE